MSMMQAVQMNPMLFQAFMQKFSPERALIFIMNRLNLNPEDLQKSQEELKQAAEEMQRTQAAAQMLQPNQAGQSAPGAEAKGGPPLGGGSQVPAEVNQLTNPKSGLPPNA